MPAVLLLLLLLLLLQGLLLLLLLLLPLPLLPSLPAPLIPFKFRMECSALLPRPKLSAMWSKELGASVCHPTWSLPTAAPACTWARHL
jgi:hypothetical protein